MTIDADLGEATCYLDGGFDGYQTGLPLNVGDNIWEQGTEIWVGVRPLQMLTYLEDRIVKELSPRCTLWMCFSGEGA